MLFALLKYPIMNQDNATEPGNPINVKEKFGSCVLVDHNKSKFYGFRPGSTLSQLS